MSRASKEISDWSREEKDKRKSTETRENQKLEIHGDYEEKDK